jgi:hypothetical protein
MRTGLSVVDRALDHDCELRVVPGALPHIAGVYPVLRERAGAIREVGQELVAVVVEVADQRHLARHRVEPVADDRHRGRCFSGVDGDADQLRSRVGEGFDLRDRRRDVRGVGIGHRLDDDGGAAADLDAPHQGDARPATRDGRAGECTHCDPGLENARAGKCSILPPLGRWALFRTVRPD